MVLNALEYLMCKQLSVNENWMKRECYMCVKRVKKKKTEGEKKGEVERHGCSFKHNSITVGGCCEEEPLEV